MKRATTVAASALLLLLPPAAGWFVRPRGNWSDTYFYRATDGSYLLVSVYPDEVTFEHSTRPGFVLSSGVTPRSVPRKTCGHDGGVAPGSWTIPTESWWNRRGFWHLRNGMRIVVTINEGISFESWAAPKWFVPTVAALPLMTLIASRFWLARRRRRRRDARLCTHCGYDMRATPQRCPECGAGESPPPVTESAT